MLENQGRDGVKGEKTGVKCEKRGVKGEKTGVKCEKRGVKF